MQPLGPLDYKEILESIQDGLVVVDNQVRYYYINKKAEQLIGIPAGKLIGKKFTDAFPNHNLNIASLLTMVQNEWSKKRVATLEIPFNPLHVWYHLTVYPLEEKYLIIFRDITAEKELREELRNSKEQLDLIFKNVDDGIVIQEASGKMVYANAAAARISGYANVENMLSAPQGELAEHYDIFDQKGENIPWSESPGGQVLDGKKRSAEAILCFVNKQTQEEIWIDIKSALISPNGNRGNFALGIFHDITLLKQLEQQKDNFLSLVSHELKTPLTTVKVYLQVLQKESYRCNNQQINTIISKLVYNTNTLIELIHSLLDISRLQEGKLPLHKQSFSLISLFQEVVDNIQPTSNHPIIIENQKNIWIYADRRRIIQVVINLLTNAMKYSESTKEIVLNSQYQEDKAIISIKDSGSGISQKDQREIFKRFYQSKEHRTFPGLGLGLFIASEIIKEHGGSIWVESKKGKGSTFYFSLPLS